MWVENPHESTVCRWLSYGVPRAFLQEMALIGATQLPTPWWLNGYCTIFYWRTHSTQIYILLDHRKSLGISIACWEIHISYEHFDQNLPCVWLRIPLCQLRYSRCIDWMTFLLCMFYLFIHVWWLYATMSGDGSPGQSCQGSNNACAGGKAGADRLKLTCQTKKYFGQEKRVGMAETFLNPIANCMLIYSRWVWFIFF